MDDDKWEEYKNGIEMVPLPSNQGPWKMSDIEFLNYETDHEGINELVNSMPDGLKHKGP